MGWRILEIDVEDVVQGYIERDWQTPGPEPCRVVDDGVPVGAKIIHTFVRVSYQDGKRILRIALESAEWEHDLDGEMLHPKCIPDEGPYEKHGH